MKKLLIFLAVIATLAGLAALAQVKTSGAMAPTRAAAPARVDVPADIAAFLQQLGEAYGSEDFAGLPRFLANDFLYQGMDRDGFIHHLKKQRKYLGKLDITPISFTADSDSATVVAFAASPRGVVAPSLQVLPLNIGATLIRRDGAWKLRGNQRRFEAPLYRELASVSADFPPSDLEAYRRLVPAGYSVPDKPAVRIAVSDWLDMEPPQTPYRLVAMSILVRKNLENIWYIVAMPETDWLAVKAGNALGFPKFVADVVVQRSFANQWQVEVSRQGQPLLGLTFAPAAGAQAELTRAVDAWLLVDQDGDEIRAGMTPLGAAGSTRQRSGWMTVDRMTTDARDSRWKDLVAPGSKAAGVLFEYAGGLKLNALPAYAAADARPKPDNRALATPPTVDAPDPKLSFWRDQVHYPWPVRYAKAADGQGTLWEVAYMDEYAGPPQQKDSAKTLVLIHGRGSNAGTWGQLMQAALRRGMRVIALDIPHYGKSIPGNLDLPLTRTLNDVREVFHGVIVDQLKVKTAVYAGHSLGGQILFGYALAYPGAVERLIAVAPGGLEEFNPSALYASSFERDLGQWDAVWKNTGLLEHEMAREPYTIEADYFFDGDGRSPGYFVRDGVYQRFMTDLRKNMIAGNPREYRNFVTSYIHEIYTSVIELQADNPRNLNRRLGELKMPLFVAMGERDPFFPVKSLSGNTDVRLDLIKPFYDRLSASGNPPQVKIYPGIGHFIYTDATEQFDADLFDFIDGFAVPGQEDVAAYQTTLLRRLGLQKKWNLFMQDLLMDCYAKI